MVKIFLHLDEGPMGRWVIGLKISLARRYLEEHYSEVDLRPVGARQLVSVVSNRHRKGKAPQVRLLEVVKLDVLSKLCR